MLEPSPTAPQELSLAREGLEAAVLLDVELGDDAALDRHGAQLKPYYVDARSLVPPSPREGLLRALLLLRSLVAGRLAEFHADVASMPPTVASSLLFTALPLLLSALILRFIELPRRSRIDAQVRPNPFPVQTSLLNPSPPFPLPGQSQRA